METKWQDKWNYYGWKEYLEIIPNRDTMQKDWNSTLVTKLNSISEEIRNENNEAEIGVKCHPSLYERLVGHLPFSYLKDGVHYIGNRYSVEIADDINDDVIYIFDKSNIENTGKLVIDFVSETLE